MEGSAAAGAGRASPRTGARHEDEAAAMWRAGEDEGAARREIEIEIEIGESVAL